MESVKQIWNSVKRVAFGDPLFGRQKGNVTKAQALLTASFGFLPIAFVASLESETYAFRYVPHGHGCGIRISQDVRYVYGFGYDTRDWECVSREETDAV